VNAALGNTDTDVAGCAVMGEKLKVRPGAEIVVSIVVRDPSGTNFSPYTFPNPSLTQVMANAPALNMPVLDHVDVIQGMVTGYRDPLIPAAYAGEWPKNWIKTYVKLDDNSGDPVPIPVADLSTVPDAAKNTSAAVIKTFNSATWTTVAGNTDFKKMTFRIPGVTQSQYVRLRGTNMPPNVPFETDANGNPLPDIWTNRAAVSATAAGNPTGTGQAVTVGNAYPADFFLKIPCTFTTGSTQFDKCPDHLPTKNGVKYVAFDVAAWADLWFYSNPIFVEVGGSTVVAGVK